MITLFKEITTEAALVAIEKESEKWDGLYCDLDNKEERKFVKEQSRSIENIRKRLDSARISKTKDYRQQVEAEAKAIDERLVKSNAPFITLIDEYKEKRAKVLADIKAEQDAKDRFFERGVQHEEAILLNKVFDMELKEKIADQKERDRMIADEAAASAKAEVEALKAKAAQDEKDAVQALIDGKKRIAEAAEEAKQAEIKRQEAEKAAVEAERLKIESNKKHVGAILKEIKERVMKDSGIDDATAKKVVNTIRKINRITISYL